MAIDTNFLAFLVPALLALMAAAVALPSKGRIERDPSTAFRRGRRAVVNLAAAFAILLGAILAGLGGFLNLEPVVGPVNMAHVGGVSLIVMAVVLLVAALGIRRQILAAGRGEEEEVLEAAVIAAPGQLRAPAPRTDLPPVPRPRQGPPPRPGAEPPPMPRRVSREAPPEGDRIPRRPPPPRDPSG
jgi:hypothetical protein